MRRGRGAMPVLLLAVGLSACSSDNQAGKGGKRKTGPEHLVALAEVRHEALTYTAARAGSLRAVREVKLFNQEEGRVAALHAREGDSVKSGQVLVTLDDRLLRAQLDKAVASLRQAKLDAQRLRQLKKKKLVSEETLTRAVTTLEIARAEERLLRTRLGYMTLAAPFDGEIAERHIEAGDVAPKHTHLLTVVDSSQLVTEVQVSELALPFMHVDDVADVSIDALGERVFRGKILRIYPTIDPATRLGQIEVTLKPVPEGARAGQFCRVTLSTGKQKRLVVPFSALRRDTAGEHVFVYDAAEAKVRRVPVTSGLRLADKVEIRQGLQPGQRVVAKGFLGLSDGKPVSPVQGEDAAPPMPADSNVTGAKDA